MTPELRDLTQTNMLFDYGFVITLHIMGSKMSFKHIYPFVSIMIVCMIWQNIIKFGKN